jgi:hypothetical protein
LIETLVIQELTDLIDGLRKSYEDFQDRSVMGQSEMDRQSRRLVRMICVVLIALLLLGSGVWWWFFR